MLKELQEFPLTEVIFIITSVLAIAIFIFQKDFTKFQKFIITILVVFATTTIVITQKSKDDILKDMLVGTWKSGDMEWTFYPNNRFESTYDCRTCISYAISYKNNFVRLEIHRSNNFESKVVDIEDFKENYFRIFNGDTFKKINQHE